MLIQGTINTRSEYLCRYVIGYYITDNSWNHMNGSYNVNTMELLRYNGTHTKLQKECMRKIHYSNMPYFHKLMVVNNKELALKGWNLDSGRGLVKTSTSWSSNCINLVSCFSMITRSHTKWILYQFVPCNCATHN